MDSNESVEHSDLQKMIFIFNAVNDGWTVKKISDDKYEFLKDNEHIKKEIELNNDYLKKFIKNNLSVKNLKK